ncbi:MAG TPA: hypothetical protein VGB85_16050 [Nannocystis sp.]|jgi:transposase-like protein
MAGEDPSMVCPRCGSRAVEVSPGRASPCMPLPPVEGLRCTACGNTGTRMRLRERTLVDWRHEG